MLAFTASHIHRAARHAMHALESLFIASWMIASVLVVGGLCAVVVAAVAFTLFDVAI